MDASVIETGQDWIEDQLARLADDSEVVLGANVWSLPNKDGVVALSTKIGETSIEERFTVDNLRQLKSNRKIRARVEHRLKFAFKAAGYVFVDQDDVVDEAEEAGKGVEFQYSITSYGADYPVDGLIKRLADDAIFIPTFQRQFVWSKHQSSRFVESLLLGLPVPAIFLGKEEGTNRLLVIDGQQRLRSLYHFYQGRLENGEEFTLEGVASRYEGLGYKTLHDSDRRRLDDAILHAIVVKQDQPDEDQSSSIYLLFERLNTGGSLLHPQEIRACVYYGPFNDLLSELNADPLWRAIYGAPNQRMKDRELILRFFTLFYDASKYARPMEGALNKYMNSNRRLQRHSSEELTSLFKPTIELVSKALGTTAFRPIRAINAAVFDSVMLALAKRIRTVGPPDLEQFTTAYSRLLADSAYKAAYESSTADEENLKTRIRIANDFISADI